MITPDAFNSKEVLSRKNQPTISALMRLIADPSQHVTFVVGAGVSIDAGLPSWRGLIARLADEIGDFEGVRFGELSARDSDDLVRKAEYLLEAVIAKRGNGTRREIVRNALYKDYRTTQPGPIALALASLVMALKGRVTIVTTNFDDVIDTALKVTDAGSISEILGLTEIATAPSVCSHGRVPIVHVHGRLGRLNGPIDPDIGELVLTESDFLLHGRAVREAITHQLRSSVTIFVGLSMTDANLIGPLWDTKNGRGPTYVLAVPSGTPGAESVEESRAYGIVKHRYLSTELSLQTIFLKSYTQLAQLLYECRVAHRDIEAYLKPGSQNASAYGLRFERLLTSCYRRLGYQVAAGAATGDASAGSGKALKALSNISAARVIRASESPATVAELLKRYERSTKVSRRLNQLRHDLGDIHPEDEVFAAVLWLRNFATEEVSRYSLRMVASSEFPVGDAYASGFRDVQISSESVHTASRALANGRGLIWNLPPEATLGVWNGVISVPLRLWEDLGAGLAIPTTVGAISLYTTHHYATRPEDRPKGGHVSRIAALLPSEKVELMSLLERQARKLITSND